MKKIILPAISAVCLFAGASGLGHAQTSDPISISCTKNGTTYRLICVGDMLPRLFVNAKEITPADMNNYAIIVSPLQAELLAWQKAAAQKCNADNERRLNELIHGMVTARIITSSTALVSFRLDRGGFIVNGQKQSFAVFNKFKTKYLLSEDKIYSFNDK